MRCWGAKGEHTPCPQTTHSLEGLGGVLPPFPPGQEALDSSMALVVPQRVQAMEGQGRRRGCRAWTQNSC